MPVILPHRSGGLFDFELARFFAKGDVSRHLSPEGEFVETWDMVGGRAMVPGVPAGEWTLRVTTDSGRTWQRSVVTTGRGEVEVSLRRVSVYLKKLVRFGSRWDVISDHR